MADRILVDTNVLLDYFLTREPFYEDAKKIIIACTERRTQGCIAAHSISNMFYILRRDYSIKERREVLSNLCLIFDVEGIDKARILEGLQNEQMECAKAYGADYIVTRNIEDYKRSEVRAILPKDYLEIADFASP